MLKVGITFDRYVVHALCFCYINLTEIHTIIVCVMCVCVQSKSNAWQSWIVVLSIRITYTQT